MLPLAYISLLILSFASRSTVARLGAQAGRLNDQDGQEEAVSFDLHLLHGLHIPRLGLGTAALPGKTVGVVRSAVAAGVRLIDTAQAPEWYSEKDVGRGIEAYIEGLDEQQRATLALTDLVIVTKVHPRSFRDDKLRRAVENSKRLLYAGWHPDKDQLDVVLIHSPYCWQGHCSREEESHTWQTAWRTLEHLKEEGKVRAIGVSNFDKHQLQELDALSNTKVSVVQNWMDPFHQDKHVREFCKLHGIVYMAYSSLGTQWEGRGKNPVLSDKTLSSIAAAHSQSTAAVVNSWLLQEGVVAIPRASSDKHIEENAFTGRRLANGDLPVFLTADEMDFIRSLDGTIGTPWD